MGEVIRRTAGGEWRLANAPGADRPSVALASADGGMCWPAAKGAKRIVQGPDDDVWHDLQVLLEHHWPKA